MAVEFGTLDAPVLLVVEPPVRDVQAFDAERETPL